MDFPGFNSLMQTIQAVSGALSSGDDFDLLQSISQLSSELAIAQEDYLSTIHLPQVVGILIQCLHKSEMAEIPFYSMSCLASLVDSLPHAAGIIVSCGGIQVLSSKLLNFEFIDLAENSIKVLEKISIEHAQSIVGDGGFESMIQTMDFFESAVQKRILNIAINVGKSFNSREALDKILVLLPNFISLIEFKGIENVNQNEKCIDFFIVTTENLMRLVGQGEETKAYFNHLKELQLVRNLMGLMAQSNHLVLKSIKLLRCLNKYSAELCNEFLSMGGSDIIKEVLSHPFENPALALETLKLVSSVLPIKESTYEVENKKLKLYLDRPQFLRSITEMIFPRAVQMYEELVNPEGKTCVIEILEKTIQLSSEPDLRPFVSSPNFASFLSEVLGSKDYRMVEHALKIINSLSDRMNDSVSSNFIREGVFSRVSSLKDSKNFRNFKPLKDPLLDFDPVFRRCVSDDTEPNSRQIFEELMSKIRSRALDLSEGPPSLFFQSSFDSKIEYQQNLINLSRAILEKQKIVDNKSAGAFAKELGKFVKLIEGSDSAVQAFIKITKRFATGQRYSSFEVVSTKLPEALLKWLSDGKVAAEALVKRLYEFLAVFMKNSPTGESYFEILVSVLIGALQYAQNFNVAVNSFPGFSHRRMNQKVRLQFLYCPEGEMTLELIEKHELYLMCSQFSMNVGQYFTFNVIKNAILNAKTSRDLSGMKDSLNASRRFKMINEYSDDDYDDYSDELQVKPQEDPMFSLVFNINNQIIDLNSTIYDVFTSLKIIDSPTIKFKLVLKSIVKESSEVLSQPQTIYSFIISESNKSIIDSKNKVQPYIQLLKILFLTNDYLQSFNPTHQTQCLAKLSIQAFRSPKLTSLLSRQIQEQSVFLHNINPKMLQESIPTIPSLPSWVLSVPKSCRFLFPYSIREQYLHSFIVKVPLTKSKARANRSSLLEKAVSIMSDTHLIKQGQLEIDYENEVGTGIGPSLEFFSLVSGEIRKLKLWRGSDESGLFPLPEKVSIPSCKEKFHFIGRFVGKALADKRQIDLNFSPVFWKLVLNQPVTVYDVGKVDKSLGAILVDFHHLLSQRTHNRGRILYRDTTIESLNLSFILPGYEKIELKPGGKNQLVTSENLEEYVNLVTYTTLMQTGQAAAFRAGLEVLIPISALELFSGDEMEDLLCGQIGSPWKMEELQQHIQPAHGFNPNSPVFNNLLVMMSEFSLAEQRKFLQFITGSPRLPVGGFAALNPKLTVVRKDPSIQGMHPDEYLPSVMTCQNYLKIPEYSSFEILQRNLKYAIQEGHESFYLS